MPACGSQNDTRHWSRAGWIRLQLPPRSSFSACAWDQRRLSEVHARRACSRLEFLQLHLLIAGRGADIHERIAINYDWISLSSHLECEYGKSVQSRDRFELHLRRIFVSPIAALRSYFLFHRNPSFVSSKITPASASCLRSASALAKSRDLRACCRCSMSASTAESLRAGSESTLSSSLPSARAHASTRFVFSTSSSSRTAKI